MSKSPTAAVVVLAGCQSLVVVDGPGAVVVGVAVPASFLVPGAPTVRVACIPAVRCPGSVQ